MSLKCDEGALDDGVVARGKTLGSGQGCDSPGGVWVGVVLQEKHVKRGDIVVSQAWA